MLVSLIAAAALAGPAEPQVVTTAPRGDAAQAALTAPAPEAAPAIQNTVPAHGLSTDAQIARWLSARAPDQRDADAPLWQEAEPRRVRGEVSAGIGSHGYRDFSAWASMPLGERAELTLGFSQTRNAPWAYGYGHGYGYGDMYGYGMDWARPFSVLRGHGFDASRVYGSRAGETRDDSRPASGPAPRPETPGRP
ncbi:hypothetical protein E4M02_00280 [Brevundimonas sp. S30B]|uniref:hypothetical protein n=1 Tax=unclassified Brevundimonas TaxID=2622653 RepID=UPI0010717CE2|nr:MULTISPECIES: hypothetical protein [unclassified Brevundimonas]QBX37637.1 hypothetical protein E4M01_07540 [Brevundimonas sp. MF30-B]TFW03570.1 hypothetical protein E4M02_00280 [Brevundimonas sp. S30B]